MYNPEIREKIAPEWKKFCETGNADPSLIRDFIVKNFKKELVLCTTLK